MANTICLSTDMQTLYLIPNPGTRRTLSLRGNGVNVSIANGEITANAASQPATGTSTPLSTSRGQWTVFFNDTTNALEVIGIIDMAVGLTSYSLSAGQTVNLKVTTNDLIATQ